MIPELGQFALVLSAVIALFLGTVPLAGTLRYNVVWQSLARQVRQTGSLSPKQAECAAKVVFGRRTKKNEEAYWTLVEGLTGAASGRRPRRAKTTVA